MQKTAVPSGDVQLLDTLLGLLLAIPVAVDVLSELSSI